MKLLLAAFFAHRAMAITRQDADNVLDFDEEVTTTRRWAACGKTVENKCEDEPDHYADPGEIHEVRCCSDSETQPSKGWKKRHGCNVWGGTNEAEMFKQCFSGNLSEARAFCTKAGARLCTKKELDDNCVRGTGCLFNRELVWSATEEDGKNWAACGKVWKSKCPNEPEHFAPLDELHEVRCCSDSDNQPSPGWKMHQGCDVWAGTNEAEMNGTCFEGTFSEAETFCAAAGARLCTKDELENNCVRNTGCRFNRELIWTSTIDDSASGVDDPHMTNVNGDTFDLWKLGEHQFFRIPITASRSNADIIVNAVTKNITSDWRATSCLSPYITEATVSGRSLQHPATFSVRSPGRILVRINGVNTQIGHEPLHLGNFSGRSVDVKAPEANLKVQKKKSGAAEVAVGDAIFQFTAGKAHINIVARGLLSLGARIGGLLGEDDHADASRPPSACPKKVFGRKDPRKLLSARNLLSVDSPVLGDTAAYGA